MTLEALAVLFAKEHDFLKFDGIRNKRSSRPDIHAFLLLNDLVPGTGDMVGGASHDEIFLAVDCEKLAASITADQVEELRRCGVRYDEETDGLAMFV